jgi:hypothetical protein
MIVVALLAALATPFLITLWLCWEYPNPLRRIAWLGSSYIPWIAELVWSQLHAAPPETTSLTSPGINEWFYGTLILTFCLGIVAFAQVREARFGVVVITFLNLATSVVVGVLSAAVMSGGSL